MLQTQWNAHRQYLLAHTEGQRLFLALHLLPEAQAAQHRPPLSVAFAVDTSGSMREKVTGAGGATTKLGLVMEALRGLISSDLLDPHDQIALVKFDDTAEVVLPFTPAGDRAQLLAAAGRLEKFSGGTQMGAGMNLAMNLLAPQTGSRRLILLTDGQTFDEEVVTAVTEQLAQARIPVTAIGVGADWNEDLLSILTDRTQGKPLHVMAGAPQPPSLGAHELPQAILGDLKQAAREVVTGIGMTLRAVAGVKLERVTRVYPTLNEVDLTMTPYPLGNAAAGDESVFVLELSLPARPPVKVRLAQVGLTYQVPGAGYTGELPPLDITVEFTQDEGLAARLDPTVMNWVQQRNIEAMVKEATAKAESDPEGAKKTLQLAKNMTLKLGNQAMTVALDNALNELNSGKTISAGTAKTLKIGAKTQTLRMGQDGPAVPSPDELRKLTGI